MVSAVTMGSSSSTPKGFNLIVGLFGILFSLGAVEIAVRSLVPLKGPKRWNDRPHGYFIPTSATNLQGESPQVKQVGAFRISVVGDSFTFAPHMQYQDTFVKKLEGFLNLDAGTRRVEVFNMGVSGASTADEVRLVDQALEIDSDLVILQITLNDAEPKLLTAAEKAALYDAPYLSSPIFTVWRSLGFVARRIHNTTTVNRYIDYHTKYFRDPVTFKRFDDALKMMKDRTKRKGVTLAAVLFPLFDFPINDRYPFKESHEIINGALRAHSVPALDLREAYRGIPPERLQVIPQKDSHPNEIAHRIAAERLLAFLGASELIPKEVLPQRVYRARRNLRDKRLDIGVFLRRSSTASQ